MLPVRSPGLRETALAAAVLSVVAAVLLGPHVTEGGFYSDDWANAAEYHFAAPPRLVTAANAVQDQLGARFLLGPAVMLPHALFGLDYEAHLGLAAVLSVVAAVCFYVLLRTLRFPVLHAGPPAVLALLFPWSDSTRLWSVAGINTIAVILYFLSVIVALHSLRWSGRRGLLVHGSALLLFVLAVMTYEAPLAALFLSILLYRHFAPSRTIALSRWRADVLVGLMVLLAVALLTERSTPSLRDLAKAALLFPAEGTALAGHSILPIGLPDVLAAVAAMGVIAFVARSVRATIHHDADLRRWIYVGATATGLIAAAHLMFFGSGLLPLGKGTENRGNLLAGYGYVVLAFSVIMLVARLLRLHSAGGRAGYRSPSVLAGVAILAVAVGYAVQLRQAASAWDRAVDQQTRVLQTIRAALPTIPRESIVYVARAPLRVSSGIPVFTETWDMTGAVRLTYDDPSLAAYPIDDETTIVCARRIVYPSRQISRYGPTEGYGRAHGAAYGKAFVVDARTGRAAPIDDQAQCTSAARALGQS